MADKTGVFEEIRADTVSRGRKATWSGLANGDTGTPLNFPPGTDRTVQVLGTFGTGGHLKIEGSLDGGTTWAVINDPTGNALDFRAAGIKAVMEHTLLIRPHVTAGDGSTSLTCIITATRMRSP